MFTGPSKPTEKELNRCAMLVRRNKVHNALTWLKINHKEYTNIMISQKNLEEYKENVSPVTVVYRYADGQAVIDNEEPAVHENPDELTGTSEGPCVRICL